MKNHSLVFKQTVLILLSVLVIFGVLFAVLRAFILQIVMEGVQKEAVKICEATVKRCDLVFFQCESIGRMLAQRVEEGDLSGSRLPVLLERTLLNARSICPEIVGVVVALEPGAFGIPGERMVLARSKDSAVEMLQGGDYLNKSWYTQARDTGKGAWCEPFVGEFIREPIVIFSIPFYEHTGRRNVLPVWCVLISLYGG